MSTTKEIILEKTIRDNGVILLLKDVYDAKHNTITEVRSFKYGYSLDKYSATFAIV